MNVRVRPFFFIILCVYPGMVFAQIPGNTANNENLRGLQGVNLIVEKINPDAADDGLTTDVVRIAVENRLRGAGIPLLEGREGRETRGLPMLHINVLATHAGPYYAVCTTVSVWQMMLPIRGQTTNPVWAPSWATKSEVRLSQSEGIRRIKQTVEDMVDEFINAYLAVNTK